MRFGRLPSPPEKLARRLMLAEYLTKLPTIPKSANYNVANWGMFGNDTVGDCTCAGAGHAVQIAEKFGQHVTPNVTTAEVLAAYSAITGYDPAQTQPDGSNPTDAGANMLDVLRYWQHTGIAGQKLAAYVAFNPKIKKHWEAAIYLFGCVYCGVWLPQNVVNALPDVIDWTDTRKRVRKQYGHTVIVSAYLDSGGLNPVTWGTSIYASWPWIEKYCDEAYVPLLPAWVQGDPPGFNMKQLMADLKAV